MQTYEKQKSHLFGQRPAKARDVFGNGSRNLREKAKKICRRTTLFKKRDSFFLAFLKVCGNRAGE